MVLHITRKLADKLKISPPVRVANDEFHSWRANYVQESGFRFVVVMNDASRFTIVINDAKAAKLKKLPELFIQTLRDVLLARGVNPEVIDRYIGEMGNIVFSKNSDRKKTAQLNKNTDNTWWALRAFTYDVDRSLSVNEMMYNTSGADDVIVPTEKMLEMLSKYGLPVRKCRAFDIKVRLDLDGKDAVRRLRVPANITFERLHKLLQNSFEWQDCHLYSFGMFEEWSGNYYAAPDVELVMSEEDLDVKPDAIVMKGLKLSDYVPDYRKILYRYDFGDDWHHYIEVETIIDDCDDDIPILLSGEGDAPPEDVGGPGGYAEFLDIISDPTHEAYEYMNGWAKSLWWRRFDFDTVAWRVNANRVRSNDLKKASAPTADGVVAEARVMPLDKARFILEFIKKNPDRWGTVIAAEPQWICNNCGEPAKVLVDDYSANEIGRLCDNCYNIMMAEYTGASVPETIPKQLSVKGRNGKPVEFDVEFLVFETGKTLTATETGKRKRKADVFGTLDDDFDSMLDTLMTRIKKALSVTYMDKDGHIKGDKAVGYVGYAHERGECNVIIDGLPYTFHDFEKIISSREGWKVKIEFASIGDELD